MGARATIPLDDRAGLAADTRRALGEVVQEHLGLDDLVRWGGRQAPPVRIEEVVIQDELTHDVIVPLPAPLACGREGLWLVYDTT